MNNLKFATDKFAKAQVATSLDADRARREARAGLTTKSAVSLGLNGPK